MNIIELNHIDLNSIGLNSKIIDSVGKSHGGKVKPYIKGHITDGSSTFTFTVNSNESVTVPVDTNGSWKWVVDRTLTSLYGCLSSKTNLDIVEIVCPDSVTNLGRAFYQCSNIKSVSLKGVSGLSSITSVSQMFVDCQLLETLKIGNGFAPKLLPSFLFGVWNLSADKINNKWFANATDLSRFDMNGRLTYLDLSLADNCVDFQYILQNNGSVTTLNLPNIKANVPFICGASNNALETVTIKSTKSNLNFAGAKKLSDESVVNIFNAVTADDITLTFHATVFAMIEQQLEIEDSPIYNAYWNSEYDFEYTSA